MENKTKSFNFEEALRLMKKGIKIRRVGWDDTFLVVVYPNCGEPVGAIRIDGMFPDGNSLLKNFIVSKTDRHNPAVWTPTNDDIFADDWCTAPTFSFVYDGSNESEIIEFIKPYECKYGKDEDNKLWVEITGEREFTMSIGNTIHKNDDGKVIRLECEGFNVTS